jgi:hypothetical protein
MNENLTTTETSAHDATGANAGISLSTTGLAIAGVATVSLLTAKSAKAVSPPLRFADIPGSGDIKVLNYALALEDLETELYVQALQRLTGGGSGGRDAPAGTNITGLRIGNSQRDVQFTRKFAEVEREHRDFLRAQLGNNAIQPFKYDFNMESLNRRQVVNLIYTAEKTGVAAYLGAVPFFSTAAIKTFIPIAAAIQGTEARHTAIFADVLNDLFGEPLPVAPPPKQNNARDVPLPPDTVLSTVSPFIITP